MKYLNFNTNFSAEKASKKLKITTSQCIIVSGVSGAEKTMTTNNLTKYICKGSANSIFDYATELTKVLDTFGNAETAENPNSSRFIKLLKVNFFLSKSVQTNWNGHVLIISNFSAFFIFKFNYNSSYEVTHASVSYQLLEKSRVCSNIAGSNFNNFYTLVEHGSKQMKEDLRLHGREFKVESYFNSKRKFNCRNWHKNVKKCV